jgi:hypothetical protein
MAIFASIFAAIGNQAGRFLTTALGWASTLLFGRVPQSKQVLLAVITFGSLVWVVLIVGVILPDIGAFVLAAVPIPNFIDQTWVRLAMLVGALVTPLLIGVVGLFIVDAADRPRGLGLVRSILRGYPLAFLLAFTLVFLAVVGVVRKVRTFARRWTDAHIPIVVRRGGYDEVVDDLDDALRAAGFDVERRAAPAALSVPAKLVALVAGGGVGELVPDRLVQLRATHLEVDLYPSDIAMSGLKAEVARARAAIASRLTATAAHLTTSKEAQAVEDRIEALARREPTTGGAMDLPADVPAALRAIDESLATLDVDYDEWEVLYRMRLQVERDLRIGSPVGEAAPGAPQPSPRPPAPRVAGAEYAVAGGLAALVVIDLGLAALDRLQHRDGR